MSFDILQSESKQKIKDDLINIYDLCKLTHNIYVCDKLVKIANELKIEIPTEK